MLKSIVILTLVASCEAGDPIIMNALNSTGSHCNTNTDCSGGVCLKDQAGLTFPGGYCSQDCTLGPADCVGYSLNTETCLDFSGTTGDSLQCVRRCSMDSECRDGYWCYNVYFNPLVSVCLPHP